MARLRLRVDLAPGQSIGPGKIGLLEGIAASGSISAAARAMGMSYRRAWLLLDALNQSFEAPVVITSIGGKEGGGAQLSPLGETLVARFRAMERDAATSLAAHLDAFTAAAAEGAKPDAR